MTDVSLHETFLYHKDAKIIPMDEAADIVLPTEITFQLENSINYCNMLLKDLYRLRKKVITLSQQVQHLSAHKKITDYTQEKYCSLPFIEQKSPIKSFFK